MTWYCYALKKTFFIMRITLMVLLLCIMQSFALKSYTQDARISLSVKEMKLEDILLQIENKTMYRFAYNKSEVNVDKSYSLNINDAEIDQLLDQMFSHTSIKYKIIDRQIILTNSDTGTNQQQKSVSGKVSDSQGNSLPGVSVVIKGTTIGTITDVDGKFSLPKVPENSLLQFSFVGMKMQEVIVSGKTEINVILREETIGLEEVVAVGYGVQKKVNMTGAVSSVKFDEIASNRPLTTVSSALAGLSSGVTVKQSVGKPGSEGATIRIRGIGTLNNNDPLVIIDGMEGVLDAVNPQDIESVSILKDAASASIYGSRAANGVILVTTKKGDKKRLSVSYNGIFSIAEPTNILDLVSDYPTYMKLINQSARNIGTAENFAASTIEAWEAANKNPNALNSNGVPNYVAFPNTDWNDVIYKKNLVQDHTVSVNGATSNARFLLSAGYMDNPGLVDYTGMKRYSLRSNVEIDINKWLTVGTRTYGSMSETELGDYKTVLTYMYSTTPGVYPEYNGKYGYAEATEESAQANNVWAQLHGVNGYNRTTRINSTLYSKVKILKGLSWDLNFNYARRFDEYNSHSNPEAAERIKFSNGTVGQPATSTSLLTTYYKTYFNYNYTLENLLHYETTLAEKHNIKALVGYNETYYDETSQNATKQGLIDENVYVFDAATNMLSIGGSEGDWALRSWFGRLNYDYKQRYLFEANLRYDGSSRFDSDTRFGVFPSFAAGWRISEEEFMKNSNFFQNLKLRASWGKLGNNSTGYYNSSGEWVVTNYDYQSLYSTTNYSFNGAQNTGLYSAKVANKKLKWETTTVTNVGLEASILNNRLTIEAEAYNKVTDGILTTPPIYLTMGLISAPTLNTAKVTNNGFELNLGWKDKIGQVRYSISGSFGYNKNKVTSYKGKLKEGWNTDAAGSKSYTSNIGDVSSGSNTRIVEDHIINEYYLMDVYSGTGKYYNTDGTVNIKGGPKDGMIRTPEDMDWLKSMIAAGYQFMPNLTVAKNKIWYGDYIYADINGDGIYGNSYDRKFTNVSGSPKIVFGSQMNFSWKNFDLDLIWSGQAGAKIYWLESGYNNPTALRVGWAVSKMLAKDHYYYNDTDTSDPLNNITSKTPRLKLNESDGQNTQASTRWLYNASYLRLKNLTLGYNFSQRIASKIHAEKLRIYFSAENLLTITSFPGLDPEMGGNTNYPLIRQIAIGTNITF